MKKKKKKKEKGLRFMGFGGYKQKRLIWGGKKQKGDG